MHQVHGRRGQPRLVPVPPAAACRPPLVRGRRAAAARTAGVTIRSVRVTIDRLPSGRWRWGADRCGAASAAREGAGGLSGRDARAGRREGRSGRTGAAARTSDASGAACGFEGTGVAADGGRTRTAGAGGDEAGEAGLGSVGRGAGVGTGGAGRGGRGVHGCPAERPRLTAGVRTVRDAPGQWPLRPAVISTRVPSASAERRAPPPGWGRLSAAVCGTAEGRRCAGVTDRAASGTVAAGGAPAGRELRAPREDVGGRPLGTPPPGRAAAVRRTVASAGGSALAEAAAAAPPAVAPITRHMSAAAASFRRPSRPAARLFSCCRTR